MRPLIQAAATARSPESLAAQLAGETGLVLLHGARPDSAQSRYSLVTARPFLTFRSFGSHCEIGVMDDPQKSRSADFIPLPAAGFEAERTEVRVPTPLQRVQFGNPWRILGELLSRYEQRDDPDVPFPLGGCFGFWGYDLKNFVEPKLPRTAVNDLSLPDCQLGFYDSLVAFDHQLGKTWIISTGLNADGSRSEKRAREQSEFWQRHLEEESAQHATRSTLPPSILHPPSSSLTSNLSRAEFLARVARAQGYIRAGHIYQVNLSQRLTAPWPGTGWELFERLLAVSPAPFAAFLDCGDFQLASSSPELFLRLDGSRIITRPIKGTRPRAADADKDARLAYELQTSAKENAELLMITDLLRNDLGKVCEYGSVQVPDLMRLERFAQVQHLVSTVEGRLRSGVTHLSALAACFPGGSIAGAPKFRAMEIIDELEQVTRGPFTGALGYLGFNRASQFSIIIRTAIYKTGTAYFPVGAGIVADSQPEAEYDETLAKAAGFLAALAQADAQLTRRDARENEHPASSIQHSATRIAHS